MHVSPHIGGQLERSSKGPRYIPGWLQQLIGGVTWHLDLPYLPLLHMYQCFLLTLQCVVTEHQCAQLLAGCHEYRMNCQP